MNEFKFNCPACGQHILAEEQWVGRKMTCPSCNTQIQIPAPALQLNAEPVTETKLREDLLNGDTPPPTPPPEPKAESGTGLPTGAQAQASLPPLPAPEPVAPKPAIRVAVLTPEVKLEMVRAVRERVADPAAWLPGTHDGKLLYATKGDPEKVEPVDIDSPEAKRFSLIGAFLLELHQRNVSGTATGRRRLLEQEIPQAIRTVRLEGLDGEARATEEEALAQMDRASLLAISHEQCLRALDALEARYTHRMSELQDDKAKRKLGNARLPDLVRKLEKNARIPSEEVATALYHELVDVRRRLERLERSVTHSAASS